MNALDPQVQFLLSLVLEVVNNYDVDGIHGDRLPALPCEGGYDLLTVERYRKAFNRNPPQNPKNRGGSSGVLIFSPTFSSSLSGSQSDQSRPFGVYVPNIYDWGLKEYLQDSQAWLERGLVDLIHPQSPRLRELQTYIDRLVTEQFTAELSKLAPTFFAGSLAYRISPEYLLQVIKYNRYRGIQGRCSSSTKVCEKTTMLWLRYCDRLH